MFKGRTAGPLVLIYGDNWRLIGSRKWVHFFDALSIYRGGPHNDIKLNRRTHNENEFSNRNELFQKRGSCWQLADQSEMAGQTRSHRFQVGSVGRTFGLRNRD